MCHPRGGHIYRDWPFEYWNELNNKIINDFPDVKILYGGSKNEYDVINNNIKIEKHSILKEIKRYSLKNFTLYDSGRLSTKTLSFGNK